MNFLKMSEKMFRSVIEALLEDGEDITSRDEDGATILHHASWNGHLTLVEELVERHHVEVSALDLLGRSARDLAADHGHDAVVAYLESVSETGRGGFPDVVWATYTIQGLSE